MINKNKLGEKLYRFEKRFLILTALFFVGCLWFIIGITLLTFAILWFTK